MSTQRADVLAHLESGKTLTPLQALGLYGVGRLAARVHELRALGHDIKSQQVEVETRAGRAKVAEYSIPFPDGLFAERGW